MRVLAIKSKKELSDEIFNWVRVIINAVLVEYCHLAMIEFLIVFGHLKASGNLVIFRLFRVLDQLRLPALTPVLTTS